MEVIFWHLFAVEFGYMHLGYDKHHVCDDEDDDDNDDDNGDDNDDDDDDRDQLRD